MILKPRLMISYCVIEHNKHAENTNAHCGVTKAHTPFKSGISEAHGLVTTLANAPNCGYLIVGGTGEWFVHATTLQNWKCPSNRGTVMVLPSSLINVNFLRKWDHCCSIACTGAAEDACIGKNRSKFEAGKHKLSRLSFNFTFLALLTRL